MNIVSATNDNFYEGLETLFVSICLNNSTSHNFYVLHSDVSKKHQLKLEKLLKKYNSSIQFIECNKTVFDNSKIKKLPRYIFETCIRLLVKDYLPAAIDRFIYLDPDIVNNGSLEEFYNTNFDGKTMAAICSKKDGSGSFLYDLESDVYKIIKITLKPNQLYFNAGVLLIDFGKWKETITLYKFEDFVNQNYENIVLCDQDILNGVFADDLKQIINRNLNCTIHHRVPLDHKTYKYIKQNVINLHFVQSPKPWKYSQYWSRLFFIYNQYYSKTHPLKGAGRLVIYIFLKPFQALKILINKIKRTLKR